MRGFPFRMNVSEQTNITPKSNTNLFVSQRVLIPPPPRKVRYNEAVTLCGGERLLSGSDDFTLFLWRPRCILPLVARPHFCFPAYVVPLSFLPFPVVISGQIVMNATSPAPCGDLRMNRMRPFAGNQQKHIFLWRPLHSKTRFFLLWFLLFLFIVIIMIIIVHYYHYLYASLRRPLHSNTFS